jgi:hypothetical protein
MLHAETKRGTLTMRGPTVHRGTTVPIQRNGLVYCLVCALLTCGVTSLFHAHGVLGYCYYLLIWSAFMFVFDREQLGGFLYAYSINGLFTVAFVAIQIYNYPESYGTTSPFGSQSDDSYFFSLIADAIPAGMETRDGYYLYSSGFSDLIRILTPFRVTHPLDVVYFLSGVAGLLAVYTKQLANQLTGNKKVGRSAYVITVICPLFLMSGGAILLRDTLVGALFILSLCCINRRRYLTFIACNTIQLWLRPGTAFILIALYGVFYMRDIVSALTNNKHRPHAIAVAVLAAILVIGMFIYRHAVVELLEANTVVLHKFSREGMVNDYLTGGGRGTFVWIQLQPTPIRLVLASLYMLLTPFFTIQPTGTGAFDFRIFLMGVIYPIFAFFIHAWALTAVVVKYRSSETARLLLTTFLAGCLLIGVYSLESRHKAVIQPIYYIIAAMGLRLAPPATRIVGYSVSAAWLVIQLAYYIKTSSGAV